MMQQTLTWDEIAGYFDEKQGDAGDLWHRGVINPDLLRVVGDVSGKRVLDVGCGNGALCRTLARAGAAQVVGADMAAGLVERGRQREETAPLGITYHVADAADLSVFPSGSFDVVTSNMALLDMTDATVERFFKEAARLLAHNGRLVACTQHPCFEGDTTAAWVVEKLGRATTTVWRKVSLYREHYEIVNRWFRQPSGEPLRTASYHRPLAWYFRAFKAAGLAVTAFEENEPTQEFVEQDNEGEWIRQIPLHCVFEAQRLP